MNPLIEKFDTTFGAVPFDKIKEEHFLPALKKAIEISRRKIQEIVDNPKEPDFNNTILSLERSGEKVDVISGIFFNLNSAETNDTIQKIAQEFSPILTEYSNDILLNQQLFEKVRAVYEQKGHLELDVESQTLIEKTYKGFIRNGANLKDEDKKTLREIDKELSQLSLKFGENLLKETNNFQLYLESEKDLMGLPKGFIEAAALEAKNRGKDKGWIITLDYPSYIPFMTYSENRELRKHLFKAFGSRSFKDDELDNQKYVLKLVKLRSERAKLLGYSSHADFVLEERMAGSPQKVNQFLDELLNYAKPIAKEELERLKQFAKEKDDLTDFQRWDMTYYAEKLKKEKYSIDDEALKPYFQLEKVIDGVFKTARKLYGLVFKENQSIPVYHKDVKVYEVEHGVEGKKIGLFYADFFPRAGKRGGAWMTSYRGQKKEDGLDQRPHISIVCNFTKPTESEPSLLTFNEVTTLFHEFGHALHGLLADGKYQSLTGTNVYWDFVELPSQVLENWVYQKECLDLFAHHFQTGEKIPEEMIKRIKESANFNEGIATLRQLGFAKLDMAWHQNNPEKIGNVSQFEQKAIEETNLLPEVKETNSSCAFAHIFQGGYSSGYYSYKWAEVLDADAFEFFQETGVFNKDTATLFRNHILSAGGSEHPMTLYKRFRGKEPSVKALLKRSGLLRD
ncbi:M3 family metallopeptidase [Xanthovirga aplysinae]|uniref:M3 family metallopeptidase n=1 Tax=Xanthovirga aplysinae TaxID=2529853 RepID=UPI0012BC2D21|nr:M3 family metallopeptidase [Xanthovirga aplysinae]MTI33340.1 M3 family peptidase [Xanthovirga aplysinae]